VLNRTSVRYKSGRLRNGALKLVCLFVCLFESAHEALLEWLASFAIKCCAVFFYEAGVKGMILALDISPIYLFDCLF
jgi:hypothetical protein